MLLMSMSWKCLLAALVLFAATIGHGQQKAQKATVEMQYCGMRMGRPPLKYLSFNVTMRNRAGKAQWFLLPRALYEQASGPPSQAGVNGAEILSDSSDHKVTLAQFMGSIRLQPESAGGFQALLLPAGAVITIRDFPISFWGDNFSVLPIHVVIANQVMIGSVPADRWSGVQLLSSKSADLSFKQMSMVRSKFTQRSNELLVTIQKSGEITVTNAMAKSCPQSNP
jgi:hypothetical protein